jgi:hypothetical protein
MKQNMLQDWQQVNKPFEEFEDTKGVIRIRILTKSSQHNDQKKKYKRTNNDQQKIHINKGNNKITELRTILQRESQNS